MQISRMSRRRSEEDEARELAALSQAPRQGEIWWCQGGSLGLNDGSKTRPVLVVDFDGAADVLVLPLTSQKPETSGTLISHRGGVSWMTGNMANARRVGKAALISPLGMWPGFAAWKNRGA